MCIFIIFLLTLFATDLCKSSLLNSPHKCGISDAECQRSFFQYVGSNYAKKGIPELNIPLLDPMKLENVTVSFKDLIDITLVEGNATGIGDCIVNKYETNIKKGIKISDITCDIITIEGYYKLNAGPALKSFTGDSLRGDGQVKVDLRKWVMNITFPFEVEKRENGEIYLKCLFDKGEYTQHFEDINVDIKGVKLRSTNISNIISKFINENWRDLIDIYGRTFSDVAIDFYFDVHKKFFHTVPVKYFIIEDLSAYVKNK